MSKIVFKFHWSFIALGVLFVIFGRGFSFLCYCLTILLHEFGHLLSAKKLGYKLNMITFMPYGAGISGKDVVIKNLKDEFLIVIAGPLVNLFIATVIILLNRIGIDNYFFSELLASNISTFLFNVLPVYPLDGGRIFSMLCKKLFNENIGGKFTKIVGIFITSLFFVLFFISYFTSSLNYMLGINGIFLLIGVLDDDSQIYYQKAKRLL